MDRGDWELAGPAQERARRKTRRRNDAFRERLRQKQAHRREIAKLKVASLAAAAAWAAAVAQFLR